MIGKFKIRHYINYMVIGLMTLVLGIITLTGGKFDNSLLFLLEKVAISMILAVSLSLLVGFLGELSLGHAGFMCVGAYLGGKVAVLLVPTGNSADLPAGRLRRCRHLRCDHRHSRPAASGRLPGYRDSGIRRDRQVPVPELLR